MNVKLIASAYKAAVEAFKSNMSPSEEITQMIETRDVYRNVGRSISFGSGVSFQTMAYDNCPHLQAVILKKAQAITRGKLISVDEDQNPITAKGFKDAMKVINRPNKYQSKNEFIKTVESFCGVYGVAYVYKIKPAGFDKITGLIVIPNNSISVTYNRPSDVLSNNAKLVSYYQINLFGKTYMLRGDDTDLIYELRDVPVNVSSGHDFEPKSRIDAISIPVKNIIGSLDSRNRIVMKSGADIILSPEKGSDTAGLAIAMQGGEVTRLQDDYAKYGRLKDQFHTMITKVPMKALNVGLNVSEMGLFDGENADHRAIANQYNVPAQLLGMPDTAKFNTYLEAKREFYEDAIIPDAENISQMFDDIFESYKNGYTFYFDFSDLECMQKSQKDKAVTFSVMVKAIIEAKNAGLINETTATNTVNDYI